MPAKLTTPSKFQLGSQILKIIEFIAGKRSPNDQKICGVLSFVEDTRQHDDDDGSSAPAHSSGCGQGVIWFTMKPPDSLATTKTKIQQNSDTIHFLEIFNFLFLLDR